MPIKIYHWTDVKLIWGQTWKVIQGNHGLGNDSITLDYYALNNSIIGKHLSLDTICISTSLLGLTIFIRCVSEEKRTSEHFARNEKATNLPGWTWRISQPNFDRTDNSWQCFTIFNNAICTFYCFRSFFQLIQSSTLCNELFRNGILPETKHAELTTPQILLRSHNLDICLDNDLPEGDREQLSGTAPVDEPWWSSLVGVGPSNLLLPFGLAEPFSLLVAVILPAKQ